MFKATLTTTLAVLCFFILRSQAVSKGQKGNIQFGSWGDRSGQDVENLSNNDKLLSMWETFLWSHMFKLYTLKRLTDDIKTVFHLCRAVDLMTDEEGLVRHNKEGEQVGDKMTEIGEYQKQGKIENTRKKKNVGGGPEEEKEDEDEQNMSPWIKNMLRRMG